MFWIEAPSLLPGRLGIAARPRAGDWLEDEINGWRSASVDMVVTVSGSDLIAFVKNVQAVGGMGVFQFHGIGGEYLSVPASAHLELLNYLQTQPDIWVGTFGDILTYRAKYPAERNTATFDQKPN
ncbi:hypothetical protein [Asticcacaulis sp.]|uniref:hypothetical protein n=1 Tax=Asticcacaulis sp. TaxID=1872648 RepID=UPI0026382AA0|nr:hypothetical protein [Asticcacaulis sp.]